MIPVRGTVIRRDNCAKADNKRLSIDRHFKILSPQNALAPVLGGGRLTQPGADGGDTRYRLLGLVKRTTRGNCRYSERN